jgi:membrane protein required for beta-lactamase induction
VPSLLLYLIMCLLHSGIFLLIEFLLEIIVLTVCLGMNESNHEILTGHFEKDETPLNIILKANHCLLPTILIYIALGPIPTLAYKITYELKQLNASSKHYTLKHSCTLVVESLHWMTIRVACLFFALMGDFNKTFQVLKKHFGDGIKKNDQLNKKAAEVIIAQAHEETPVAMTRDIVLRTLISILALFALYKLQFGIR